MELLLILSLLSLLIYYFGRPTTPPPSNPPPDNPKLRPITASEEVSLRNCFPWGVYYLQNLDYYPQAILCRGRLQAVPEQAYQVVHKNLQEHFGDRFLLLFQESFRGQPFFAVVPNPWAQPQPTEMITRPGTALILLLTTLFSTTLIGAVIAEPSLKEPALNKPELLLQGIPYSLGLVGIILCHEMGHYLASLYYKIQATLPYFIPEPFFLGTFGAFVQKRSPVPNRKVLFDIAIAGPIFGLLLTIPLLLWGLSISEIVPLPKSNSVFNFNALDPKYSFLLSLLTKIALPRFTGEHGIHLHPLAVAGYLGLIMTAINLIPIGQLDGGNIVHAMFGQSKALIIAQVTKLLLFLLALTQPAFLLCAIFFLLMPANDQPVLNDVTELDNWRDGLGLASLTLLVTILLPIPEIVTQWINL